MKQANVTEVVSPEPKAETQPQTQALATIQSGAVGAALPPSEIASRPPITAAQAKVDAVAALTMSAYEKAATLQLTPEEAKALQADFPDDAFQPGAAGKENLIYIEHAHLRDRFTQVFGMGKWAIVPRNRWADPFMTKPYQGKPAQEGSRVYVEAMLIVRGCFVGEAVGAMEYYPHNAAQNYGDAVEGAKTAAFRRCAKEFGVGLQAWKKEWCEGWWARKRGGRNAPGRAGSPPPPQHTPQSPKAAATPTAQAPRPVILPTAEGREKMIRELKAGPGEPNRDLVTEYVMKAEILLPTEAIEDIPLRWVPATAKQMRDLVEKLADFGNGGQAAKPYPPNEEPPAPAKEKPAPAPAAKPEPETPEAVDHSGMEQITGTIQYVSQKQGTSNKGPWVLYGIKICDGWINTFSDRVGALAQDNQGKKVTVWYTSDDKGRTAHDLTVDTSL
jgi:hypothetical protein